ncbi:MAG: methylated-DNA--[protein]-cysteine S-methyltransferase [Defluviitaleaceae bacterium]|nr:methylated-DNA--[protein]-cysteine S-methyltransferase [Defluviitaleaceae bacterium]
MQAVYESSQIGALMIESGVRADGSKALKRLDFPNGETAKSLPRAAEVTDDPIIVQCARELDEYFSGTRKMFDVPIMPEGTPFREKVWGELSRISYGEAISYAELARRVGNPKASRAVGGANHNNPISIIIPCHRVIAANGSLCGYGGEVWRKEWLLEHEGFSLRKPSPRA